MRYRRPSRRRAPRSSQFRIKRRPVQHRTGFLDLMHRARPRFLSHDRQNQHRPHRRDEDAPEDVSRAIQPQEREQYAAHEGPYESEGGVADPAAFAAHYVAGEPACRDTDKNPGNQPGDFDTLIAEVQALLFLELLREVQLDADLIDRLELVLDPVDVRFFVGNHILEHLACRVVTHALAVRDGFAQGFDCLDLELQVQLKVLEDVLAHAHLVQALHVRHALEVEDVGDDGGRVLHLGHAGVTELLRQPVVAPVTAYLGLNKVLIYRG